jgi:surfactin synthase thioesterase subunit/glycosyltransferase involved in cell wall biosynthesis
MRILLAQNSLYYPAHGGGDKSNRLLIEALAARGHECRAVARTSVFGEAQHHLYLAQLAERGVEPRSTAAGVVAFGRNGVDVRVVTDALLRAYFANQIEDFRPDVILASTDDPAQLLLEAALRSEAPVVYLVRATLAVPFGPDCAFPSEAKTARIRSADRVVGVSRYVADYIRRYAAIDAVHVPISLMEPREWPALGSPANEFVTLANPCAVKGISIFLALADSFPDTAFAAVPTWGTNEQDRAALRARPNVRILDPVDNIELLLKRTRVLLVPSLWAEARSRIIVEAMLCGVPVMAADVGGIPEAKMGVPYLLPVNPITKYRNTLDEQMVPVAEVPPQDAGPWREALARLLHDPAHYSEVSACSRAAALNYTANLTVEPFERLLLETPRHPGPLPDGRGSVSGLRTEPRASGSGPALDALSPDRRRLLALRLRRKTPAAAWFPGIQSAQSPRLFCFPHAGGGAAWFRGLGLNRWSVCPILLPGRESRLAEAPYDRMAPLVEALATAMEPWLAQPFAFFGHSMGAVVAFELARLLRARGLPLPRMFIASSARASQYRRNHVPPPEPPEEQFLAELRRLEGMPVEVLDDRAALRAVLPALQADAALYRRYVYSEGAPLPFPIRAWGGDCDPNIALEHLDAWKEQTTSTFAVRLFPGGHFYLNTARVEFLAALDDVLNSFAV